MSHSLPVLNVDCQESRHLPFHSTAASVAHLVCVQKVTQRNSRYLANVTVARRQYTRRDDVLLSASRLRVHLNCIVWNCASSNDAMFHRAMVRLLRHGILHVITTQLSRAPKRQLKQGYLSSRGRPRWPRDILLSSFIFRNLKPVHTSEMIACN